MVSFNSRVAQELPVKSSFRFFEFEINSIQLGRTKQRRRNGGQRVERDGVFQLGKSSNSCTSTIRVQIDCYTALVQEVTITP